MVTFNQPEQLDASTWLVSWSSDLTPPVTFWIYVDGQLIATTTASSWTFSSPIGVIEVLDTSTPPADAYPSKAILTWNGVAGAQTYLVQEYVESAWVNRASIVPKNGQTYFAWTSGILADSQTHQFQVLAVGVNQNDGTAASLNLLMVRNPDPPDVSFTYDPDKQQVVVDVP